MTAKKTVVLNLKALPKRLSDPLYIGRGSIWGNPFTIGKDGDRETVLRKYKRHLWNSKPLMAQLPTLRGKQLLCFCHPLGCHGHVLVKALAWLDSQPSPVKTAMKPAPTAAEIEAARAKRRAAFRPSGVSGSSLSAPTPDQAEDLLIAAGLSG